MRAHTTSAAIAALCRQRQTTSAASEGTQAPANEVSA